MVCCATLSRSCSEADADPPAFADAARDALADQRYDSVVCAAVNAFGKGTEDIILALENVAAEATKPLIGVFLDFHPPLSSWWPAGCSRIAAQV